MTKKLPYTHPTAIAYHSESQGAIAVSGEDFYQKDLSPFYLIYATMDESDEELDY